MFTSCMLLLVWQCNWQPEKALYNGGILKDDEPVSVKGSIGGFASIVFWPAFILHNLTQGTYYRFANPWHITKISREIMGIEFIYTNSNCFSTFGKIKSKSSVAGTQTRVSRVRAEYPNQLDYNGLLVHNFYYSILYVEYRTTSILNIISTLKVSSKFFFFLGESHLK